MTTITHQFTAEFDAAEAAWRKTEARIEALRQADHTLFYARYDFVEAARRFNHWQRFADEARANPLVYGRDEVIIAGYQADWHKKAADEKRQCFEDAHMKAITAYRKVRDDLQANIAALQAEMTASDDHPDSAPFRNMLVHERRLSQEMNNLNVQIADIEDDLRTVFQIAAL